MSKIRFRGLRVMTKEQAEKLRDNRRLNIEKSTIDENDCLSAIFAPDPITGNPASDLYFDCKNNNELRQYINDELQRFHLDTPKTSNVDDALAFTKSIFESRQEYAKRLRDFVAKQSER